MPDSFEEALKVLEDTVRRMESGGLTLDESTELYEQGIRLARFCSERIARAELKITQIKTAYGEQMRFIDEREAEDVEESEE
jgi:exodeoxyribonuclease VII small subunit